MQSMGVVVSNVVAVPPVVAAFRAAFPGHDAPPPAVREHFGPGDHQELMEWLQEQVRRRFPRVWHAARDATQTAGLDAAEWQLLRWLQAGTQLPDDDLRPASTPGLWWRIRRLPAGTKLYHGTKAGVTAQMVSQRPNFFADHIELAQEFAEDYREGGVVHTFELTRTVELLLLYAAETRHALEVLLDRDCVARLRITMPYVDTFGRVTRHYGSRYDRPLCFGICELAGVRGVYNDPLPLDREHDGSVLYPLDEAPRVPAELFLCDPAAVLRTAGPTGGARVRSAAPRPQPP